MELYNQVKIKIIENTPIPNDRIFDFELSPHKDEYNAIFEFYYTALEKHVHYGIEPYLLFYYDDTSINAAAALINGHYTIKINKGTVKELIEIFKLNEDIIVETDNEDYIEFEKLLDTSINELMYQNALHFTFYHEMAHLIQKSDLLEKGIEEQPSGVHGYSIERHILELDADQFSALCMGTHIIQYAKGMFGDDLNVDQLKKLIVTICSSALVYLLSFKSNSEDIYFEENSHPHPVIRITLIVFHVVGYCSQSMGKTGVELNIKEIVNECLEFSDKILQSKFEDDRIEKYKAQIGEKAVEITDYIKKMRSLSDKDKTLASYKWNQVAT